MAELVQERKRNLIALERVTTPCSALIYSLCRRKHTPVSFLFSPHLHNSSPPYAPQEQCTLPTCHAMHLFNVQLETLPWESKTKGHILFIAFSTVIVLIYFYPLFFKVSYTILKTHNSKRTFSPLATKTNPPFPQSIVNFFLFLHYPG